ncbi:MAG: imidazoleglycerol-phosphate dehydratase HisB [Eubacterium sp.]|nr:imidazoleglycerol-phosphate dehydratase HisB [Eubacterium sp.]
MSRFAHCERNTRETQIDITLCLDGTGEYEIDTGIGFFNHMLEGFARHGLFDLSIQVQGDTEVDAHHTVEDTGIVLGQAFLKALGNKEGISRFGYFVLPMDDALVLASLDFSGRTYFSFDADLKADRLGTMETEVVKEFFMGLASGAQMNLHIRQLAGENTHHVVEAMFKAVAKAMDMASRIDERIEGVLSTKGAL